MFNVLVRCLFARCCSCCAEVLWAARAAEPPHDEHDHAFRSGADDALHQGSFPQDSCAAVRTQFSQSVSQSQQGRRGVLMQDNTLFSYYSPVCCLALLSLFLFMCSLVYLMENIEGRVQPVMQVGLTHTHRHTPTQRARKVQSQLGCVDVFCSAKLYCAVL